jgi:hypothetical protein
VRKLLKRWLGQALDDRAQSLAVPGEGRVKRDKDGSGRWFAVGGSVKCVWDDDYFHCAYEYIRQQRLTALDAIPGLGTSRL